MEVFCWKNDEVTKRGYLAVNDGFSQSVIAFNLSVVRQEFRDEYILGDEPMPSFMDGMSWSQNYIAERTTCQKLSPVFFFHGFDSYAFKLKQLDAGVQIQSPHMILLSFYGGGGGAYSGTVQI